jgi:hypothetical protein
MKILLIDIDSKIPNLALKKIEKYYSDRGHSVVWNNEFEADTADKIFVSCVFDWNKHLAQQWEGRAEIGGSGYSLSINLPVDIEETKPRINFGFTTRGCIRNCYFCIVPKKEGTVRIVGDIYDIWNDKDKELIIMDNNILALPEHFMRIASQLKKEKLKVDFNQGLDHRLLTNGLAKEILSLSHIHEIRFAFDNIQSLPTVEKALDILRNNGLRDWATRWYVYIGEKDNFDSVFQRMEFLRKNKQGVYVMRDKKIYDIPMWQALSAWGNTMGAFKMNFEEVFSKSKRLSPYRKFFPMLSKNIGYVDCDKYQQKLF